MCGIIGLVSEKRDVVGSLVEGVKRLEYRGYDSVGVALQGRRGITIAKKAGKIDDFLRQTGIARAASTCGIGHTRWATHGPPTDGNAHPHQDCTGSVALVHNGVIRNYSRLRGYLLNRGHTLKSNTDTELIAHLIEEEIENSGGASFLEAMCGALLRVEGSYALAVLHAPEPNRIYFAKMRSTLLLGIGDGIAAVASDLTALVGIVEKVLVLEDGEMGYITPREIAVYRITNRGPQPLPDAAVQKRMKNISISPGAASKSGYPHYMIKEIHEQPQAVRDTYYGAVDDPEVRRAAEAIAGSSKVVITGAGTSLHAGLLFSFYSHMYGAILSHPLVSSEYKQLLRVVDRETVVVAISQSGETFDTLEAVRHYKSLGAKIVGVTNVVGSALDRESHMTLYIRAGPEIGVAATKTYLAQTMLLQILAVETARASGSLTNSEANMILGRLSQAGDKVSRSIRSGEPMAAGLAEELAAWKGSMYILGRGLGDHISREAMLKIKEIAYLHAEAYPAGESKHGPIALIENGFPVFIVATSDSTEIAGNALEMDARGARVWIVRPADLELDLPERFNVVKMPPSGGSLELEPYILIPYFQLAAYYLAVKKGYDPDKPRNLAKTVTVE